MADAPPPEADAVGARNRRLPSRGREASAGADGGGDSTNSSNDASVATAAEAEAAERLCRDAAYRSGLGEFDAGAFFECHETLEAIWLRAEGRPRLFLQGLIQWAVACYKWRQGNRRGALVLHGRAREKWRTLPAEFGGLPVAALREQFNDLFGRLEAADPGAPLPPLTTDRLPCLARNLPPTGTGSAPARSSP